uniref:Diacylglycerol kinase n=1 Tax=Aceria tosichella TaxID=561515 RepID=A0A6G1S8F4_9ACAR
MAWCLFAFLPLDSCRKFIQDEIRVPYSNGETRALKLFVDWDENCANGEHLWVYMGSSSEACYVGESECLKHGPRLSCSACKITAHTGCIEILTEKIKFICKPTLKDLTVSNPYHLKELQQQSVIYHHWVHKRTHCGRCKQCTKTIGNTKLPFSSKEIQAITCSWCKVSYHNKENCYTLSTLTEPCTLGAHRESIIPPSWILKLPPSSNTGAHSNGLNDKQHTNQLISDIQRDYHSLIHNDNQLNLGSSQLTDDEMMNLGSNQTLNNAGNNNNSPFAIFDSNDNKENVEITMMRHQQDDIRTSNQQKSGSNTTLTTETSGYVTTDNSNIHSLISNNNRTNHPIKMFNNNNRETDGQTEIIMDSTALHAADLSMINQYQGQPIKDRQQLLYRQQQQQQCSDINLGSSNGPVESQQLTLYQHTMDSQNARNCDRRNIYQNFKIVPQPIPGVPTAGSKPVLVFVNPRSGGNQGAKMMQKFNWLLNPRQVFDLIQSNGPRAALELYRDVPNLRILTIGGDGTASWILSHLDDVGMSNRIPVAVLPLGTGNDLARALGWGGGYADEPIAKVLAQVRDSDIVHLDRWNLHVERNHEATPNSPNEFSSTSSGGNLEFSSSPSISSSPSYYGATNATTITASNASMMDNNQATTNCDTNATTNAQLDETGNDRLPMDVINNYFSFGVDAHIALEFHTAREAHPERFNSRLRNKMFYGQAGGKDLLKRKWKDLSNFVTLYCDGQDMTGRLKELKVHSVLFLNIPSYGGGTRPWPTTATAFTKPKTDDGLIEVIGLTTYQLPLLQAGGHGTCIAQCRNAKIITSRTIPMQVDGEPCKLLPSIITINFRNRVCMLSKSKGGHPPKSNQSGWT